MPYLDYRTRLTPAVACFLFLAFSLNGVQGQPRESIAGSKKSPAKTRQPVCALIDTTSSPIVALLEARLLELAGSSWVERNQIEQILAEKELQLAFAADAAKHRTSLGHLLKADLLILLRQRKAATSDTPSTLECTICETRHGLRLQTVSVSSSDNAATSVVTLKAAVERALAKHSEQIDLLVAVPPFMSDDLGLERNYLQSAYAKLAEQELLDRPGVLVLELQEAQAISRELATAGVADRVERRRSPLYILGRYRHEGVGERQRLRISIQLKEGQRELAARRRDDLKKDEAALWIRTAIQDLLATVQGDVGKNSLEASAKVEAQRLAERGRQFQRFGSWSEALALFEASLLLDPIAQDVRADAIRVTGPLIRSIEQSYRHGDWIPPRIAAYQRGLEHLEIWLRDAPDLKEAAGRGKDNDFLSVMDSTIPPDLPVTAKRWPEHQQLVDRFIQHRRDTFLRIARFRREANKSDGDGYWAWDARAVTMMSAEERYALILRLAEEWRDQPNLHERITRMAFADGISGRNDAETRKAFIAKLKMSDSLQCKIAANNIEERIALGKIHAERFRPIVTPPVDENLHPKLIEVKIGETDQNNQYYPPRFAALGEPGVYYFMNHRALYRTDEAASLRMLYSYDSEAIGFHSMVFDGRFVWVVSERKDGPLAINAIDPITTDRYTFTAADGVPTIAGAQVTAGRKHRIEISPIDPGKVCVVGFTGQSWIATAEVDANQRRRFDIFFESREAETSDEEQRARKEVVFYPISAFTLKEPNQQKGRRILIRRDYVLRSGLRPPLLVDPIARQVQVAPYELYDPPVSHLAPSSDGTLFVSEHHYSKHPRLMRIRYPGTVKEKFVAKIPYGLIGVDDRGVHIVGRQWSLIDPENGAMLTTIEEAGWHYRPSVSSIDEASSEKNRSVAQNAPYLEGLQQTSPYGVLAIVRNRGNAEQRSPRLFKVETSQDDLSSAQ